MLRHAEDTLSRFDPADLEEAPDRELILAIGQAEAIRNAAWSIEKRLLHRAKALAARHEWPWREEVGDDRPGTDERDPDPDRE